MTQPKFELFFAVRLSVIAHYCGRFFLIIAALNLVVLIAALLYAEFSIAVTYGLVIAGLLVSGLLLRRVQALGHMQMNEAMVLAATVFLLVPTIATLPLIVHGIPFIDAWFETVSAATTTGLSTLGAIEQRPETFRFARAWMQWYGGLGIIVFSLALVVRPGMSALRLSSLEAPDDLVGGTRAHARSVLMIYLLLTSSGVLLWLLLGGAPLEGLLYSFSAVSTGGFAPSSGSLADLSQPRLAWVVSLMTISGAVPLALYQRSWREGWRQVLRSTEFKALLCACLLMSGLLAASLWGQGMAPGKAAYHGPLLALSAQTTAGFSSLDPGSLGAGPKALLILAMATGGSVGSTAGGFKLLRLLILLGLLYRCLKSLSVPTNTVLDQRLGPRRVEMAEVQDALMIILLFVGTVFLSWLPFLFSGYAPLDALFEVVSATGTVGLSTGITAPGLSAPLKFVLCADMLLGRLEFVAWMVFFYHRTWFGRKREI